MSEDVMYQARMMYLDDVREFVVPGSLDASYPHIVEMAEYKVAKERDSGCAIVRHNDTWLVSVSDIAAKWRGNGRSYAFWIEQV